jgi:hypothetical protein
MRPRLELVRAAHGIQRRLAGLETEMVRIVQTQPATRLLELVGREALERRLRGHGHEDGEGHGAMRKVECRSASLGDLHVGLNIDDLAVTRQRGPYRTLAQQLKRQRRGHRCGCHQSAACDRNQLMEGQSTLCKW